jgi:ABC-type transporter Mla subunit MlaD
MRLEKDDAKIGILVALTLALFLGFIFQRSLSTILREVSHVKVRLDSASDVAEGTEVQLQGLRVGQVASVALQRDGVQYRFLASLDLRPDIVLWEGTRVVVVSKPLGGAFMDLQLPPPDQRREVLGPQSVLPGAAGPTLATLVDNINSLVVNLNTGVDELRAQFKAKGLGSVLDHPQMREVFRNLNGSLQAFQQLALDGRKLVQQGGGSLDKVDRSLATLNQCLSEVQTLLDHRSGDLDAIVAHLTGALNEVEGLAGELRVTVQQAGPEAGESLKSLDRSLRSAEELLQLLKVKPSRLIWGKPTQAEKDAAASSVDAARKKQGAKP